MANFRLGRSGGTDQRSATLLCAHLSDMEIVGDLEKQSVSRKPDHFVIISVDGKEVLTSKKKPRVPTPRWEDNHQFWFQPSSMIKIDIFRESILRFRRHLVGRFTGKDTIFELTDENDAAIIPRIKITLSLISESPEAFMHSVDADVARLDGSNVIPGASGHLETTLSVAQTGSVSVQALGNCVAPLGQALQLIVKVMDSIADAHPILKASWTVLSSVYKAVRGQMLQDDDVRILAESLREMVGVAAEYPDLPLIHGTTNIIEDIGRLSLQIALLVDECAKISFIGRTIKYQISNNMMSRINEFKTRCRDLMGRFDRRVGMDTNQKVDRNYIGMQRGFKTIKDDQLAKEIYQWLYPPDSSGNYNEAREKHQVDTCSWFITGIQFEKWKTQADIFLWIYGLPGCGKTILCSSVIKNIIEHCELDASRACAYFFFDGRDSQKALQLHGNLIRSLILQFSDQCDGMPAPLVDLHAECNKGHLQPSIDSLINTLQNILGAFDQVYIIIDALDECTDRVELLKWIKKITGWKVGRLHLLVTSRQQQDIEGHLRSLHPSPLCMADESANHDIRAYVNWILQTDVSLSKWDEQTQGSIAVALMEDTLQLDELKNCPSLSAVEEQLKSLPKDLDETYDRILMNINPNFHKDTKTFLEWCAFSARPLKLEEIATVAATEFNLEKGLIYNPKRQYKHKEAVLVACSSLVTHSEGVVKLAHFSVKEYLVSERIQKGAAFKFSIDKEAAHLSIAQTCLAYLLQFDTPGSINSSTIQSFPLAQYAGAYWIFHVHSGDNETSPTIQKLILNFFGCPFDNWIQLWNPDRVSRHTNLEKPLTNIAMPLYYTSLTGLQQTSQQLLENGADVNAEGGEHGNALQAASANGYDAIVKLLLEIGADTDAKAGQYGSALQAASIGGHEGIVKLLLDKGADVNAIGGPYGIAVQAASENHHVEIVKVLLDNGANANAKGGFYGNALQTASAHGYEAIVKLLLENRVDVNAKGGPYGNALQAASENGHERIVKLLLDNGAEKGHALQTASTTGRETIVELLLENGADANTKGGPYDNALQAASAGGHEVIVRLLLENGADVNAEGGEYGCALQAASNRGHKAIVKLLLDKGADVNIQRRYYGTALQTASAKGLEAIVKLLLDNGADVNAKEGFYGNALQAAVIKGHEVIVRLLLDNGANVNVAVSIFGSALQAASVEGHEAILKLLLENGADINAEGGEYGSALQAASIGGHEGIVKLLLENGADINAEGGEYGNALQAAGSHEGIVRLLLDKGADAIAREKIYGNALQTASAEGYQAIVQLLLLNGADINAKGGDYGSALHAASENGQEEIVKLLLQNGADVNAKGGDYGSALQAASENGHEAIVKLLLENGAV